MRGIKLWNIVKDLLRFVVGKKLVMEGQAGFQQRAYKHVIIAAKSGHKDSLARVKVGFSAGCVQKMNTNKRWCLP